MIGTSVGSMSPIVPPPTVAHPLEDNVLNYEPTALAQQLTLIEWDMFSKVEVLEVLPRVRGDMAHTAHSRPMSSKLAVTRKAEKRTTEFRP